MKVLLFAQLRELLGCSELQIDGPYHHVADLRLALQEKGTLWQEYLAPGKALVAVNQTLADDRHGLGPNDEVAFFPPVTGG
ncbi:MoaD/ThiS family protein [Bowmanella dokdonensis]|uniref:MoaD/ThiS family protein n=1 Tax=Bowmanella dokdonensis TaxID=751969 RepID=A0A939DKS5_9ALTE|nr:MoaD/ThiS family protein [Bowmanella dokdonensis]MBN7824364.1 MoaD/ThiS family protein [Bowmanella dokdonensis]